MTTTHYRSKELIGHTLHESAILIIKNAQACCVITPSRLRGAVYCDQVICVCTWACVCVCLSVSVCPHGYLRNHVTDLHHSCACLRGSVSVLLWCHCDMLCTSGFVDDVTVVRNGPCGIFQHRGGVRCL